jgi:hypothetical protein
LKEHYCPGLLFRVFLSLLRAGVENLTRKSPFLREKMAIFAAGNENPDEWLFFRDAKMFPVN